MTETTPATESTDRKQEGIERLDRLTDDPRWGLVAIKSGVPETMVRYDSCRVVDGRPAIEVIGIERPHLVDESNLPGGSPPPCTFGELVADHGCAYSVQNGHTYVIPAIPIEQE